MTFKANWEKASSQVKLPARLIEQMVELAYPHKTLLAQELMSEGCANLNIKINLAGANSPLILRIYLRNKDAVYREQKLAILLKHKVPIPSIYYIGNLDNYRFAITEFLPGITLSKLLLGKRPYNLALIMHEVGLLLSRINAHKFPESSFFDKNLNVIKPLCTDNYLKFGQECLKDEVLLSQLTPQVISKINYYIERYSHLLPDESKKNLVHADFDPSNILVQEKDGNWKVSGILDWEFSFSGSILDDVANMLRYAHHMPPLFEDAFFKGLIEGGDICLPKNWQASVYILNILSLIDCLKRTDTENNPNRYMDICTLLDHILLKLGEIK